MELRVKKFSLVIFRLLLSIHTTVGFNSVYSYFKLIVLKLSSNKHLSLNIKNSWLKQCDNVKGIEKCNKGLKGLPPRLVDGLVLAPMDAILASLFTACHWISEKLELFSYFLQSV